MISKEKIKHIISLHNKKNRTELRLFLVEWQKNIEELLNSNFKIQEIFINKIFEQNYINKYTDQKITFIDEKTVQKISTLQNNTFWVALVEMKENIYTKNDYVVILDGIQDPWNLWTIIRSCDWYGVTQIVASNKSVDFYNPKVISATMWSFTRVGVFYTDLEDFLQKHKRESYGAFLTGESIYDLGIKVPKKFFLVVWSESHWISSQISHFITTKITIPRIWHAESLNAWIAHAILMDNLLWKRWK